MSQESWTQEQFEQWWADQVPGAVGRATPCECGEDHCHGWRMIVISLPPATEVGPEGRNFASVGLGHGS